MINFSKKKGWKKFQIPVMLLFLTGIFSCHPASQEDVVPIQLVPVLYQVKDGILQFSSTDNYIQAVEKQDQKQREAFVTSIKNEKNYVSFREIAVSGRTLSEREQRVADNEFISSILNQDRIVGIGDYWYKVDVANQKVMVLAKANQSDFSDLKKGKSNDNIMVFSTQDDVITIMKAIEKGASYAEGSTSDATRKSPDDISANWTIKWPCFRNRYADANKESGFDYTPYHGHLRHDSKVVYQTVGIYYSLQSKCKTQYRGWTGIWDMTPSASQSLEYYYHYKVRCDDEYEERSVITNYNTDGKISFRPYESTRALQWYTFKVRFFGLGYYGRDYEISG